MVITRVGAVGADPTHPSPLSFRRLRTSSLSAFMPFLTKAVQSSQLSSVDLFPLSLMADIL